MLAAGAALLVHHRSTSTMDPWYLLLLVLGVSGVSFTVGWVLGYLTESGAEPGSEGRE